VAYRLKRDEDAAAGIRRVARERAAGAVEALAAARDGQDAATQIHAARKDLKKLRAVLRLARRDLGEELFETENRRYRDAARLLSRSRDAEVKLETLGALEERFGEELPSGPLHAWCLALEEERSEVSGAEGETAGIERAIAAIAAGREGIAAWLLRGDSWKPIGPGLRRSYRGGRKEMIRTCSDPSAEHVHQWRKRVKDLWYQLRLIRKAWPTVLGATVEEAHRLADLLGDHHDLAVLGEDLGRRDGVGRREVLSALVERRQEELLEEALALGSRLYAEKPRAFEARIETYWRAWRR
jgi:CHAD domain-containing protein